ncbi:multidrug resistance protein [Aspergillus ellipticus CBS 707.79]|uniref:Multidrug resistance protein n=1 Tax=Aspergillus ellipticus CBS 707.79 TaxID=1448320 RepID=A0A319CY91_9EURO|nr:multidrug resistance protein [Aspergillus ellipticus CBS 707.79]
MLRNLVGKDAFTPAQCYTALALIGLVTQPIQVFVHATAQLGVALGCFKRIQDYLLLPEVDNQATLKSREDFSGNRSECLSIRDANFSYTGSEKPILTNVSLEIHPSTLTIVAGPVGSGKSSLLQGLMGALSCAAGSYEIVVGTSQLDSKWYHTVLQACALDEDIATFPLGDSSKRLSVARAVYSRRKVLVLDDILSALDVVTARKVFDRVLGPRGLCKSQDIAVILACNVTGRLHLADNVITLGNGTVISQGPYQGPSAEIVPMVETPAVAADKKAPVLLWAPKQSEEKKQDMLQRVGDVAVYKYYMKSLGYKSSLVFLGFIVVHVFGIKFPDLWLTYWTDHHFNYPLSTYLGVYWLCAGIQLVGTMLSITFLVVILSPKSSRRLHMQLLTATMKAPYLFFVKNDTGNVLNRFSQDISQIDTQLASALLMSVFGAGFAIAETMLIAAGNKYIAITIPFVILVIYALQNFNLRTSRQLRFLELEASSPLYTHFLKTASGVDTIRAFGWQDEWTAQFHQLVNTALQPYYMLFCVQRWLNLVLDPVTTALAVIVITVAVELSSVKAGAIAVSLLNILDFSNSLSYLITSWTQLETSLGAVARIKSYEADLPREDAPEMTQPPDAWPSAGHIKFDHVYASYESTNSPSNSVLQDITLTIKPGERVAICGRSGSGKSSFLLLLFRLLETSAGSLSIDDIDLKEIPCETIRERLTMIPQDPLLLPGALRSNLDPSGSIPDVILMSSLDAVHLWEDPATQTSYSLDMEVNETTFSRGQRQLLSLARALLDKEQTKVLVLDEISSSVDAATEDLMLRVIQEAFRHATILAVTHRLRSIRDFHTVLIMEAGGIVERGSPAELLGCPSFFKELWERQ